MPAFNCGGHCYAVADWTGPVNGARTFPLVVHMNGGDVFAANILWMVDTNPGLIENCRVDTGFPNGYCWVEGGYKAFGTNTGSLKGSERWYWADLRPGSKYYEHDANLVLSQNDYNNYAFFPHWQTWL